MRKTLLAKSSPTRVTDEVSMIDLPTDGSLPDGAFNDGHLGTLDAVRGAVHPISKGSKAEIQPEAPPSRLRSWNKPRIMVASRHVARPDSRKSRRRAQSGADDRGRARDRRSAWARAAARRRGRRVGQDGDACASGRGAHPRRRRPEAHHACDLLAPRGG